MLLFAGLAEALGSRVVEIDGAATVGELLVQLCDRWPELGQHCYRVAVDQRYVDDDRVLRGGEEVALIPPVSGG